MESVDRGRRGAEAMVMVVVVYRERSGVSTT
jgi:hypothetical protein